MRFGFAAVVFVSALIVSTSARADTHNIEMPSLSEGSEIERTTSDPGWWQRTFVGWDSNGDGRMTGGERGIGQTIWDGIKSKMIENGTAILDKLLDFLPTHVVTSCIGYYEQVLPYGKVANCWFPMDLAIVLIVAFYTFQVGYWICRMALKIAWC